MEKEKLKIREKEYPNLGILLEEWEAQMNNSIKYDDIYNKFSFIEKLKYTLNFFNNKNDRYLYLFVASVLKKGFFWNKKFLKEFFDEGESSELGLLTDESGMGWISKGKKIKWGNMENKRK